MNVVGMMWNYNEGDVLEEIISEALPHVDSLFIADDESTDNSWDIIQSFQSSGKLEYTRRQRNKRDKGQRQALLDEIKKRYKPEDTWVQIIESDIMILDTDVRDAIKKHAVNDMAVSWQAINGVRAPGTWEGFDTYPNWDRPIKEILPYGHRMEVMLYTFRPLPGLSYDQSRWRPWPQGWGKYGDKAKVNRKRPDSPLLAHYGYRGPTHFYHKYKHMAERGHRKYKTWKLSSPKEVEDTVFFFNGHWNNEHKFPMSREGWSNRQA